MSNRSLCRLLNSQKTTKSFQTFLHQKKTQTGTQERTCAKVFLPLKQTLTFLVFYFVIVDEKALRILETCGYHKDYLLKSLDANELNYATTAYYLFSHAGRDNFM